MVSKVTQPSRLIVTSQSPRSPQFAALAPAMNNVYQLTPATNGGQMRATRVDRQVVCQFKIKAAAFLLTLRPTPSLAALYDTTDFL